MYSFSEELYMKELFEYADKQFLSGEEQDALILLYRDTLDARVMDKILKQCMRMIIQRAKKYSSVDVEIGDTVHAAIEGVIGAIKVHYNPGTGTKFTTYIKRIIDRRIKDCADDSKQCVEFPKNIKSDQGKLKGAGEVINGAVLYSKINMGTPAEMKKVFKANSIMEEYSPEDTLMQESLVYDISRVLDNTLNVAEIKVLTNLYGLFGSAPTSPEAVGEMMGVTRQRIGSLRNSALMKIKNNEKCVKILSEYM